MIAVNIEGRENCGGEGGRKWTSPESVLTRKEMPGSYRAGGTSENGTAGHVSSFQVYCLFSLCKPLHFSARFTADRMCPATSNCATKLTGFDG